MDTLLLGQNALTLADVLRVAEDHVQVALDKGRAQTIRRIRQKIDALLDDDAPNVYGVNTGFGALAEVRIPSKKLLRLQLNLIRSHATGVGQPFARDITRAMMLLRANVLSKSTSGVRPEVPELLCALLNHGIHPVIPEKGSVGASGDLAPLAHLALAMIGEGSVTVAGDTMPAADALRRAGLSPLTLQAKEGLALINGTQAMTADLALSVERVRKLLGTADIVGALSVQALFGSRTPFDPRIHEARHHPGQIMTAKNLERLTLNSEIIGSHKDCAKVQDPYSLRCMPQVHGASRSVWRHVHEVTNAECDAATDNPLVFETADGQLDLLSGGNFHGQPIALAADYLALAVAELANISERRIEQLVNPTLSSGLPAFLAADSGINSGFMIAQVTAAALVSENKVLAHPASVDSIPSSANREDHVSMGTIAARKCRQIIEHAETVLGIELLCAAQGMSLRRPLRASDASEAALTIIRAHVPPLDEDRVLFENIDVARQLVRDGSILDAVESVIGPLHS
ncbi:MAG: histidine ammonia-lyase [Myxococcota bacterium]|nr:histidine ammonia-lyase [Myxococcota bacterium]